MEAIYQAEWAGPQEEEFCRFLDDLPFESMPTMISLNKSGPSAHRKLQIIDSYLRRKKIHSRFPYPVYVISKEDISSEQVIVLKDESEVPRYFQILKETGEDLESEAFRKIHILRTKINNTPIEERFGLIAKAKVEIKELFMISRESQYYEDLLELMGGPRDKQRYS